MLTHREDSLLSLWITVRDCDHKDTPEEDLACRSKWTITHDLLELPGDAVWCANIGRWVFFRGVVLTSMDGPDTSTLPSHSLPSKHLELMTFFSRAWSGQSSPNGHSLLYRKWASSVPSYQNKQTNKKTLHCLSPSWENCLLDHLPGNKIFLIFHIQIWKSTFLKLKKDVLWANTVQSF